MVKTKWPIFLLMFFLVSKFIEALELAKSLVSLDDDNEEDFIDPIDKHRKLSRIVEENAYDEKRSPSISFAMLFYVFGTPILAVGLIVLITVLLVHGYSKWKEAKFKEWKRRCDYEKALNKRMEDKFKKLTQQKITADMLEIMAEEGLVVLKPTDEFISSFKGIVKKVGIDSKRREIHKSEGSETEISESKAAAAALAEDARIHSVESVPSLDGMIRPKGGALRSKK